MADHPHRCKQVFFTLLDIQKRLSQFRAMWRNHVGHDPASTLPCRPLSLPSFQNLAQVVHNWCPPSMGKRYIGYYTSITVEPIIIGKNNLCIVLLLVVTGDSINRVNIGGGRLLV